MLLKCDAESDSRWSNKANTPIDYITQHLKLYDLTGNKMNIQTKYFTIS